MAIQNNKRILHLKEWQMLNPAPTNSAAGSFIIKDPLGTERIALYVQSATVQYLYSIDEDGYMQLPSFALAGTFGAGACGAWSPWSNTLTANGGSTTTVTTATATLSYAVGKTIRFLSGSQAGKEATITDIVVNPGGSDTIIFTPALSGAIVNTDTFTFQTGTFYVLNAGTVAANIFKSFDTATGVTTALGTTGLPATIGTDAKLIATPSYVGAYATGTATSGSATTIVNSAKTWAVNQWCNYQVRITAGTGIGQIRTIISNTATTLTIASGATIDNTSVYSIEANDDFLYLIGNNAVTMYRYSKTSNTWTTLAPTTARTGTPGIGMSGNWIGKSGNAVWADESAILDGRYIYSFRGAAGSLLDRYDIAGGTAGAGAWLAVTYIGAMETFTTGSSYDASGRYIYMLKDSTGRFFKYDTVGNYIYPVNTDTYTQGTAVLGDKLFTVTYTDGTGDDIEWIYYLINTSNVLRRLMIY
ncbi:MAG: hypothetical protein WC666_03890 [Candidatus Paceibacterota bacterium]|jgi:hypothetical protein